MAYLARANSDTSTVEVYAWPPAGDPTPVTSASLAGLSWISALDADKGTVLWQTRLPSQVVGSPISFAINGRQYIAVTSGGGAIAGTQLQPTPDADSASGANAVYVFAVPQ